MSDKVGRAFYEEILCGEQLNIPKLTSPGFKCFQTYMSWFQDRESSPARSADSSSPNKTPETAQGLSTLWKIALTCEPSIRTSATDFLVNSVHGLTVRQPTRRREVLERALETALELLIDDSHEQQTKMLLGVIDSLIEK